MTAVDLTQICKLHAEALFASDLQPSDQPGTRLVCEVVTAKVFHCGQDAIAALVAQEFGEHPEAACERMRWAISLTQDANALEVA